LDNKVFDIIVARCSHAVHILQEPWIHLAEYVIQYLLIVNALWSYRRP